MDNKLFEKRSSTKLVELATAHASQTNGAETSAYIYGELLKSKVEDTKKWMLEVAKKAAIKHEELSAACDKAKEIKADIRQYTETGIVNPVYSEAKWKEKTTPFKQLEALSEAIDKTFVDGTVEAFEKLEKLCQK